MAFFHRFDFKKARPKFSLRRPALKWIPVSAPLAWAILAALPLLGIAAGWFAASQQDQGLLLLVGSIAVVMVATSLVVVTLLIRSSQYTVTNSVAPLFMSRYGVNERARAEKLIRYLATNSTAKPEFRVVEGILRDDLKDVPQKVSAEKHDETPGEFFRRTGMGPATLWIDRESVVLIEYGDDKNNPKAGELDVLHGGWHELKRGDRLKGIVHLRPQRETVEVKGALTHDTIALDFQVAITYQIKQDTRHLEKTQSHHAELDNVRRALLPRDEWQQRTKTQLKIQLNGVLRECELWQLFLAPPRPPAPAAIAALYTMGQVILPVTTRVELENRVKSRLNDVCWKWGVEVTRVSFDQITPPIELCDAAQRAYVAWTRMTEELLVAEKQAQSALRLAQVKLEQAQVEKNTQQLKADANKAEKVLDAEGEAIAYEKRMRARADSALEFARQIQIIRQGLGTSLDGQAMRELLRALGFMEEENDPEQDLKFLSDLLARRRTKEQLE